MAERLYLDLVCPECNGVLWEMNESGLRRWYCPASIGEVAVDQDRNGSYIPRPSKHGSQVRPWKAEDPVIARQLAELGGRRYIRIERKGRKVAA